MKGEVNYKMQIAHGGTGIVLCPLKCGLEKKLYEYGTD